MTSSIRRMWLSCLVASSLIAMATAAGNEYLPPSKGYNYDPPTIPFPTNNNGNKQPPSVPFRPPATPRPSYIPPAQQPSPGPNQDHHNHDNHDHGNHDHGNHDHGNHDHGDHHHHEPGMPFDFAYKVNEDGNDYSHNAISDGDITRGEYRVALPDGRTQIVKYTADWKNGFNAEVSYEGEARYPEEQSGGYGSGPATSGGYGGGPATGGQAYVPPSQGGGYQY